MQKHGEDPGEGGDGEWRVGRCWVNVQKGGLFFLGFFPLLGKKKNHTKREKKKKKTNEKQLTGYVAVMEENEYQQPLCGMHWRLTGMMERMLWRDSSSAVGPFERHLQDYAQKALYTWKKLPRIKCIKWGINFSHIRLRFLLPPCAGRLPSVIV